MRAHQLSVVLVESVWYNGLRGVLTTVSEIRVPRRGACRGPLLEYLVGFVLICVKILEKRTPTPERLLIHTWGSGDNGGRCGDVDLRGFSFSGLGVGLGCRRDARHAACPAFRASFEMKGPE